MPQMMPMYWTLLLIYTIMIMFMYTSLLYFMPTLTYNNKKKIKIKKFYKKLLF
uniref:ATP synthase F0 subunit 8 n=1 Tax=Lasioglossum calceatum TaxID=88504 RepID=A0A0S2LSV9_9HYME|nr:ATP synthase F0 subunit 8 [Lasioglossum calceatum]